MSESYQCLSLRIAADDVDLDQGRLYENGCLGLIEEDRAGEGVCLKAYFADDLLLDDRVALLKQQLSGLRSIDATTISLSADTFKEASFDPFLLTPDLWVIPPPDLSTDIDIHNEPALIIRPGMAFGTGRHETTQLVAEAIATLPETTESLLDVGTGSGILAILARRRGVAQVDAVEISADVRRNAEGNFELNQIQDIQLFASLEEITGQYDVVVANILTPTILNLKNELLRVLKPQGRLILSGITADETKQIEECFTGLDLLKKTEKNDWCCYVYVA